MKKFTLFITLIALSFGAFAADGVGRGYGTAKYVIENNSAPAKIAALVRPTACKNAYVKCDRALFLPYIGRYAQLFYYASTIANQKLFCQAMGGYMYGSGVPQNYGINEYEFIAKPSLSKAWDTLKSTNASAEAYFGQMAYHSNNVVADRAAQVHSELGDGTPFLPHGTRKVWIAGSAPGYQGGLALTSSMSQYGHELAYRIASQQNQINNVVMCAWSKYNYTTQWYAN